MDMELYLIFFGFIIGISGLFGGMAYIVDKVIKNDEEL